MDSYRNNGWPVLPLRGCIDSLKAGVSVNSEDRSADDNKIGVLKTSSVTNGVFNPAENKAVISAEITRVKESVKSEHIILSRMNTPNLVGASAYVMKDFPTLFLPDRLWQFTVSDKTKYSPRWLSYVLASDKIRAIISVRATGTSGSMKNISQGALLSIRIACPPFNEQKRIVEIVQRWDRSIEFTERLIAEKKELRRGLMQRLLTGRLRFKKFGASTTGRKLPSGWKMVAMNEVFERVLRRVAGNGNIDCLSITATVGFVSQKDKFSKVIAGKNLDNYVLLEKGEFSYNKGNSKAYKQGCIYRLKEFMQGAVPNVYYSFKPVLKDICPEFYEHYFMSGAMNQQLSRVIKTGVRNDGLLNLDANDFFSIQIPCPPHPEQVKIAQVLNASSKEIAVLEDRLDALQTQKKSLMQQLLTGKIRVKI